MTVIRDVGSIAQSGLEAASTRLRVSADNVANANRDRFRPERVTQSDDVNGGVRVSLSPQAQAMAAHGTDLVQETVNQVATAVSYRANFRTLSTAQQVNTILLWNPPLSTTDTSADADAAK